MGTCNSQKQGLDSISSNADRQQHDPKYLMSAEITNFDAHQSERCQEESLATLLQSGCNNDSNEVSSARLDGIDVSLSHGSPCPVRAPVDQIRHSTQDTNSCPDRREKKAGASDPSIEQSTSKTPLEDYYQCPPATQLTMSEIRAIMKHLLAQKWPDLNHIEDFGKLKQHLKLYDNYRRGIEQLLISMASSLSNQIDRLGVDLKSAQRSLGDEMSVTKKLQAEFDASSRQNYARQQEAEESFRALENENDRSLKKICGLNQRIGDATSSLLIEKANINHLQRELDDKCGLLGEARDKIAGLEKEVKNIWTGALQDFEKKLDEMESNLTNTFQQDMQASFKEGMSQIEAVSDSMARLNESVDSKGDTQSMLDSIGAIIKCSESK